MTIPSDDPHVIAEAYLQLYDFEGIKGLRWWKESFYAWASDRYMELSEEHIRCTLNRFINERFQEQYEFQMENINPEKPVPVKKKVTGTIVSDTIKAIKATVFLDDVVKMNRWLGGPHADEREPVFIPVQNGIIDSRTIQPGQPATLIPHSPLWFSTTCIPTEYQPDAQWPRWGAFLETNLEGDRAKQDMLQQWFGYCLTANTSLQRFLIMEGEGNNGKSVICAALIAILGADNVSHVPLEEFGERFSLHSTVGKLANIVSEIGELDKVAEGKLKAYTGGESITCDRKNKSAITLLPTARLTFATNGMPKWADRSSGIWRRMLLLTLTYEVPEHEKIPGMDKVKFWKGELAGILNWALWGLHDLREFGKFTEPEEAKEAKNSYRREGNPARAFLEEHYEVWLDPNAWVSVEESYNLYREWCIKHGFQPLNSSNLGREVFRLWKNVKKVRPRNGIDRFNAWSGIRRRESWRDCEIDLSNFN